MDKVLLIIWIISDVYVMYYHIKKHTSQLDMIIISLILGPIFIFKIRYQERVLDKKTRGFISK